MKKKKKKIGSWPCSRLGRKVCVFYPCFVHRAELAIHMSTFLTHKQHYASKSLAHHLLMATMHALTGCKELTTKWHHVTSCGWGCVAQCKCTCLLVFNWLVSLPLPYLAAVYTAAESMQFYASIIYRKTYWNLHLYIFSQQKNALGLTALLWDGLRIWKADDESFTVFTHFDKIWNFSIWAFTDLHCNLP